MLPHRSHSLLLHSTHMAPSRDIPHPTLTSWNDASICSLSIKCQSRLHGSIPYRYIPREYDSDTCTRRGICGTASYSKWSKVQCYVCDPTGILWVPEYCIDIRSGGEVGQRVVEMGLYRRECGSRACVYACHVWGLWVGQGLRSIM
jgi:hypothetical protein